MSVQVERLTDPLAHLDELVELRARWEAERDRVALPGTPEREEFRATYQAWLQREVPHREFWIARVSSKPVGMVNLLMFERMPAVGKSAGGWGYLCNMFVDDAHRNAGVGALLAADLLDYADEQGLERVVLKPSERSRPFYASLGFNTADNMLLVRGRFS